MHKYPYSDFHELNLSYIMDLARESLGIHLEVVGKKLQLKNAAGEVISNVQISYAEMAETDEDGKPIEAYIFNAGVNGRSIVFTHGNNDTTVIPFPEDAITDKNGKDLTTYVARVDVSGNKLRITDGAGDAYTFTCPYANAAGKASTDENGKNITTYMASVSTVEDKLVFRDGDGVILAEITVPYATAAGTSEKAVKDVNGNAFVSDYGRNLVVDGNKIGIEAHDGTSLNKITVPFASLSTDATNAIKTVTISGDQLIFTTHGGTQTAITVPYSVRAQKDDLGNTIKTTYVANVTNDPVSGEISFLDAQGHEIVAIVPTVDSAVHDSLGNDITDYVKSIITSANSNFVTVTHGDNTVDSLTINYSTIAWKDTYGNAIGNTYCSLLTMGVDPQDGEPIVIGWNGETPKAEIFRLKVQAVSAQKDGLGNVISEFYGHSLDYDSTNDKVSLLDANGNVLSYINIDDAEGSIVENIVRDSNNKVESMDIDGTTYDFAHTLDDLEDTDLYDKLGGQALMYNHQNQLWEPKYPHDVYYIGINNNVDPATFNNEPLNISISKNSISQSDDILNEIFAYGDTAFTYVEIMNTTGPTGWQGPLKLACVTMEDDPANYSKIFTFQSDIREDANGLYLVEVKITWNYYTSTLTSVVGNRVNLASDDSLAIDVVYNPSTYHYDVQLTRNGTPFTDAQLPNGVKDLDDLDDVSVSSPSQGDVLVYNYTTHTWVNGSVPAPSPVSPVAQFTLYNSSATFDTLQPNVATVFNVVSGSSDAADFINGTKTMAQIENGGKKYFFGSTNGNGYVTVVKPQYQMQMLQIAPISGSTNTFNVTLLP